MKHDCLRRFVVCALIALGGCAGEVSSGTGEEGDSQDIDGTFTPDSAIVGQNAKVVAQSGLNLRTGPSTGYAIILTMPNGATIAVSAASNGWYKVNYNGHVGWCSGIYLTPISSGGGGGGGGGNSGGGNGGGGSNDAPPIGGGVANAMLRAQSAVGFSYRWGGGCWKPGEAKGACYGSCPSCSHSGQWGADCSGFVAKVWQVPGPSAVTSCQHPYSTWHFTNSSEHWSTVSRSNARRGDAFTYNSGSSGHIFLYDSGDAWGWVNTYECKGCSYGCIKGSRTASANYKVIRREGF